MTKGCEVGMEVGICQYGGGVVGMGCGEDGANCLAKCWYSGWSFIDLWRKYVLQRR